MTGKTTLRERDLARISIMNLAKKAKNDEFYTRYEDVEKEIALYDQCIWKNKVVFCNCNDTVDSNFAVFFIKNFNKLRLKKLICIHYTGGLDLFGAGAKAYIFTKDGFEEKKDYPKNFTGSFDDPLSIKILNEEADIVCTNPPFSKSADYWRLLIESGKKFLIISNITLAIHSQWISYFKQNLIRAGHNRVDWFVAPKRQPVEAAGHWYTNLPTKKSHKKLKFVKLKEIPEKSKFIDNDGILGVSDGYIPTDYKKQFSVSSRIILNGVLECGYEVADAKEYIPCKNGKKQFSRCLIRKKKGEQSRNL